MTLLKLNNINKQYGGVKALIDVSLEINAGEVHSIVGENGAGKSTLMKIISGVINPSQGSMSSGDRVLTFKNVREAEQEGICIIHQEPVIFSDLTVLENIFVGCELVSKMGYLDWALMEEEGKKALGAMGVPVDILHTNMGLLPIGTQQMILIAKGIYRNSKILILDEPTSILSFDESLRLFSLIKRLSSEGVAILYISHRIPEILELSNKITVLKDGCLIGTLKKDEATTDKLLEMMSGRTFTSKDLVTYKKQTEVIFSAKNVCSHKAFDNISFEINKGEILGLYGLVGAGRTELAQAIIGERIYSGTFSYKNQDFKAKNARDAYNKKIVYLPEDRITQGVFSTAKIRYNLLAGMLNNLCKKFIVYDNKVEKEYVNNSIKKYEIKLNSPDDFISSLSGGNQQKVLFTRCLLHDPEILILDEPTRGIDVKTKTEIYKLIQSLSQKGMTIILISSELTEIMALTDNILVMHEGKYIDHLIGDRCTEENVLKAALNS